MTPQNLDKKKENNMNTPSAILVSAQTFFALDNYWSGENFSLSPPIYQKFLKPENLEDPEFRPAGILTSSSGGGVYSTATRMNEHNLKVPYILAPFTLTLTGPSTTCVFKIDKHDNEVSYTSLTSTGVVSHRYVLYDDVIAGVALQVGEEPTNNKNTHPPIEINDSYYLSDVSPTTDHPVPARRADSKVIPDTELFSFLTNVNMYFSGPIHQMNVVSGELTPISKQLLGIGYGIFGGRFALTNKGNNLYPDGVSILEINDGFSEGTATIEFNHDTNAKTVKITILSHSSKICDIRDLTEVGWNYPHTICFAP